MMDLVNVNMSVGGRWRLATSTTRIGRGLFMVVRQVHNTSIGVTNRSRQARTPVSHVKEKKVVEHTECGAEHAL
jgi:hypothetical protein